MSTDPETAPGADAGIDANALRTAEAGPPAVYGRPG